MSEREDRIDPVGVKLFHAWKESAAAIEAGEESLRVLKRERALQADRLSEWMIPSVIRPVGNEFVVGIWIGNELVHVSIDKHGRASLRDGTIPRPNMDPAAPASRDYLDRMFVR